MNAPTKGKESGGFVSMESPSELQSYTNVPKPKPEEIADDRPLSTVGKKAYEVFSLAPEFKTKFPKEADFQAAKPGDLQNYYDQASEAIPEFKEAFGKDFGSFMESIKATGYEQPSVVEDIKEGAMAFDGRETARIEAKKAQDALPNDWLRFLQGELYSQTLGIFKGVGMARIAVERAWEKEAGNIKAGLHRNDPVYMAKHRAENLEIDKRIDAENAFGLAQITDVITESRDETAKESNITNRSTADVTDLNSGLEYLASTVINAGVSMAPYALGGGPGAAIMSMQLSSDIDQQSVEMISKATGLNSKKIYENGLTDQSFALGAGFVAGALDRLGFGLITKAMATRLSVTAAASLMHKYGTKKGAAEYIRRFGSEKAVAEMLENGVTGKLLRNQLAKTAGVSAVKKAELLAGESGTEYLQGIVQDLGAAGASTPSGVKDPMIDLFWGQKRLDDAAGGFIGSGGMTTIQGAGQGAVDLYKQRNNRLSKEARENLSNPFTSKKKPEPVALDPNADPAFADETITDTGGGFTISQQKQEARAETDNYFNFLADSFVGESKKRFKALLAAKPKAEAVTRASMSGFTSTDAKTDTLLANLARDEDGGFTLVREGDTTRSISDDEARTLLSWAGFQTKQLVDGMKEDAGAISVLKDITAGALESLKGNFLKRTPIEQAAKSSSISFALMESRIKDIEKRLEAEKKQQGKKKDGKTGSDLNRINQLEQMLQVAKEANATYADVTKNLKSYVDEGQKSGFFLLTDNGYETFALTRAAEDLSSFDFQDASGKQSRLTNAELSSLIAEDRIIIGKNALDMVAQQETDAEPMFDFNDPDGQGEFKSLKTKSQEERAAGFRIDNDGVRHDRADAPRFVTGRDTEVWFADSPTKEVSEPAKYAVMELEDLIPSHTSSGARNPKHFLPDAQPNFRNDVASKRAREKMAIRVDERAIESNEAYSGAPVVNMRGETIQGSNRSIGIGDNYRQNQKPGKNSQYKKLLLASAERVGIDPAAIEAMNRPVLVRLVESNDERAVELGNYKETDMVTGGEQKINTAAVSARMSDAQRQQLAEILASSDGETLAAMVADKGIELVSFLSTNKLVSEAQAQTLTVESAGYFSMSEYGRDALRSLFEQMLFEPGDEVSKKAWQAMPNDVKTGILRALGKIFEATNANPAPLFSDIFSFYGDYLKNGKGSTPAGYGQQTDAFKGSNTVASQYPPYAIATVNALHVDPQTQKATFNLFSKFAELTREDGDLFAPGANLSPEDALVEAAAFVLEQKTGKKQKVEKKQETKNEKSAEPKPAEPKPATKPADAPTEAAKPAYPPTTPPPKPKKEDTKPVITAKTKDALDEASDALDDFMALLGKADKLGSGIPLDSEQLAAGIKVVGLYTKAGLYAFKDVVNAVVARLGLDKAKAILPALKTAYVSYLSSIPKDERKSLGLSTFDDVDDFELTETQDNDKETDDRSKQDRPERGGNSDTDTSTDESEVSGNGQGVGGNQRPTGNASAEDASANGDDGNTNQGRDVDTGSNIIRRGGRSGRRLVKLLQAKRKRKPKDISIAQAVEEDKETRTRDFPAEHQNFSYPDGYDPTAGNRSFQKNKAYDNNILALELLLELQKDKDRLASQEEKEILSLYTGLGPLAEILLPDNRMDKSWNTATTPFYEKSRKLIELIEKLGGTVERYDGVDALERAEASSLNAYYTSIPIVRSIWTALMGAGFTGGRVLEGSAGSGRFIGASPRNMSGAMKFTAVDMDVVSSLITKYLYPKANVRNVGFENFTAIEGGYDLFISNIPFGDIKVYDPVLSKMGGAWNKSQERVHNFFVAKAIYSVRPGGYIALITSNSTLDTPGNAYIRELMNEQTDFVTAVRLPAQAFEAESGTSVTTDIILLRRKGGVEQEGSAFKGPVFNSLTSQKVPHKQNGLPDQTIQYNSFFANNPGNVLGEFRAGGLYSGKECLMVVGTAVGLEERVSALLSEATKKAPVLASPRRSVADVTKTLQMAKGQRRVIGGVIKTEDGGYGMVIDYDINTGQSVVMPVEVSKADRSIMNEYLTVRKLLYKVLELDTRQEDATEAREQMRQAYESLSLVFGATDNKGKKNDKSQKLEQLLNGKKRIATLLQKDPDLSIIVALKNDKDQWSDFAKNRIKSAADDFYTTNPTEAILAVFNTYGNISMNALRTVLGTKDNPLSEEETKVLLKGKVFFTPDGEVLMAEKYLHGDVRTALKQAREWAKYDSQYEVNVKALEEVQPGDLKLADITVKPGSPFMPKGVLDLFISEKLGGGASVNYVEAIDSYDIVETGSLNNARPDLIPTGDDRTGDVKDVLFAAITNIVKKYTRTGPNDTVIPLLNLRASCREKMIQLQEEFERWVAMSPEVSKLVTDAYNDNYNSIVPRKFVSDGMQFPDYKHWEMHEHQKAGARCIVENLGGILDHCVGAGKTIAITAAAIRLKQLGLVRKPMVTTKKSILPGFVEEARKSYPSMRILAPDESDFTPAKMDLLFSRIANNDWDLIIITHDNLKKIPLPDEFMIEQLGIENDALRDAAAATDPNSTMGKRQLKALAKKVENNRAKMAQLQDKKNKNSRNIAEMGIDFLFVDESQEFKNLAFTTKLTETAGLGNPAGSERATNLKYVSRYLQRLHGGDKGVSFASGTPIDNSLVELYNIFVYLRPTLLKKWGINSLDRFLSSFGSISSEFERGAGGQVAERVRLRGFVNVPELSMAYSEIADVRTPNLIKLDRPSITGGKTQLVTVEPDEKTKEVLDACLEAITDRNVSALQRVGIQFSRDLEAVNKAIGLVVTTIGSAVAIDIRLKIASAPAPKNSKITACADLLVDKFHKTTHIKGTQLVFCDLGTPKDKSAPIGKRIKQACEDILDEETIARLPAKIFESKSEDEIRSLFAQEGYLEDEVDSFFENANQTFDVYNTLKDRLISMGIPANEIAFAHDGKTKAQWKDIQDKVKSGDIRILIGSTAKMGIGVSVQNKIVGMHHLDILWNPGKMEQREGRGIRQGNQNKEVDIYAYGMMGSIDAYKFNLIGTKQKGIEQFREGNVGRQVEMLDDQSLSHDEFAAALSGDTRLLDLSKAQGELARLERAKNDFYRAKSEGQRKEKFEIDRAEKFEAEAASLKSQIDQLKAAAKPDEDGTPRVGVTLIDGSKYDMMKGDAAAILFSLWYDAQDNSDSLLGRYGPLQIRTRFNGYHTFLSVGDFQIFDIKKGETFPQASAIAAQFQRIITGGMDDRVASKLKMAGFFREYAADYKKQSQDVWDKTKDTKIDQLKEKVREIKESIGRDVLEDREARENRNVSEDGPDTSFASLQDDGGSKSKAQGLAEVNAILVRMQPFIDSLKKFMPDLKIVVPATYAEYVAARAGSTSAENSAMILEFNETGTNNAPYGFVNMRNGVYENTVYLNPEKATGKVLVHELLGHLFLNSLRSKSPELYARLSVLAKQANIYKSIEKLYAKEYAGFSEQQKEDALVEEVLSTAISQIVAPKLLKKDTVFAKIKKMLRAAWRNIFGGYPGVAELSSNQINKLSLTDFTDALYRDIERGTVGDFGTQPTTKLTNRIFGASNGVVGNGENSVRYALPGSPDFIDRVQNSFTKPVKKPNWLVDVYYSTRQFAKLNAVKFAREIDTLRRFKDSFSEADTEAVSYITQFAQGLTSDEAQIVKIHVLLDDIQASIEKGMYDTAGVFSKKLPFGLASAQEALVLAQVYRDMVNQSPKLKAKAEFRKKHFESLFARGVAVGMFKAKPESAYQYFHRDILAFKGESAIRDALYGGKNLSDKTHSFQKSRAGSDLDYDTDLGRVDYLVTRQIEIEIARRKMAAELLRPYRLQTRKAIREAKQEWSANNTDYLKKYDGKTMSYVERLKELTKIKRQTLKSIKKETDPVLKNILLNSLNGIVKDYENLKAYKKATLVDITKAGLPADYTSFSVNQSALVTASTPNMMLLNQELEAAAQNSNLGQMAYMLTHSMGQNEKEDLLWLPTALRDQLQVSNVPSNKERPLTRFAKAAFRTSKISMLIAPWRVGKWVLGNALGNIERAFQSGAFDNPAQSTQMITQAWKDISAMRKGTIAPDVEEAYSLGVIGSEYTFRELGGELEKKLFAVFEASSTKAMRRKEQNEFLEMFKNNFSTKGYLAVTAGFNSHLEQSYRLATYRALKQRSEKGKFVPSPFSNQVVLRKLFTSNEDLKKLLVNEVEVKLKELKRVVKDLKAKTDRTSDDDARIVKTEQMIVDLIDGRNKELKKLDYNFKLRQIAKIAREVYGDYGATSEMAETVALMVPFIRFLETNLVGYKNYFMSALRDSANGKGFAALAPTVTRLLARGYTMSKIIGVSFFIAKTFAIMFLAQALNLYHTRISPDREFWKDRMEKQWVSGDRSLPLTVKAFDAGDNFTMRTQTQLTSALESMGLRDNVYRMWAEAGLGLELPDRSGEEIVKDFFEDFTATQVNSLGPFIKVPIETLRGKSFYHDMAIRDNVGHVLSIFSLKEPYEFGKGVYEKGFTKTGQEKPPVTGSVFVDFFAKGIGNFSNPVRNIGYNVSGNVKKTKGINFSDSESAVRELKKERKVPLTLMYEALMIGDTSEAKIQAKKAIKAGATDKDSKDVYNTFNPINLLNKKETKILLSELYRSDAFGGSSLPASKEYEIEEKMLNNTLYNNSDEEIINEVNMALAQLKDEYRYTLSLSAEDKERHRIAIERYANAFDAELAAKIKVAKLQNGKTK